VAVTTQPSASTDAADAVNVGVVVWLASELMFFAGLFAAYFTLRSTNSASAWPPDDVELDNVRAVLATGVLILSSVTMHLAVHSARSARSRTLWLGVTMLLGAAFLANLLSEYATNTFQVDDNAYGSIFYLLTGFHGLHVLGGLLFMAAVIWSLRGRTELSAGTAVDVCSYYWHFVDVVWVAMFTTIYVVR